MSDKANKHKIVANISDMTRKQIDELQEATGITTTAQLVSMAIDRMHREEVDASTPQVIVMEFNGDNSIGNWWVHPSRDDVPPSQLHRVQHNSASLFEIPDDVHPDNWFKENTRTDGEGRFWLK